MTKTKHILSSGTGSEIEQWPVKEVMKLFFHTEKAQQVGRALMSLRDLNNRDEVMHWQDIKEMSTPQDYEDGVFIQEHLHLVPYDVMKLLDYGERRELIGNILDKSEKKSLCPIGDPDSRKKKKPEGSNCSCEGTYLESLKIKQWSKFARLSEGRNKYAMNEICQFLLVNRRRSDLEPVDPSVIPPNVAMAMGENLVRRVLNQKKKKYYQIPSRKAEEEAKKKAEEEAKASESKEGAITDPAAAAAPEPVPTPVPAPVPAPVPPPTEGKEGEGARGEEITFPKEGNGIKVEDPEVGPGCPFPPPAPAESFAGPVVVPAKEGKKSRIPESIREFLTAQEIKNIDGKLEFIDAKIPDPSQDEFLMNNPGIMPMKIAKLLLPEEREGLIKSLVEAWTMYQWHFLVDPKTVVKEEENQFCCYGVKAQTQHHLNNMADAANRETQQGLRRIREAGAEGGSEPKRPKFASPYGTSKAHLIKMPMGLARKIFPEDASVEKKYLLEAALVKLTTDREWIRRLKRYERETKEFGEKYLPQALIDAVNPKAMWHVMGKIRRLIANQPVEGAYEPAKTHPDLMPFFAEHERIIPKDIIHFFDPEQAKLTINSVLLFEKIQKTLKYEEKFDEALFEENAEWIPKEVAELLTKEEMLAMVEKIKADKAEMNSVINRAGLTGDAVKDFETHCPFKDGMRVKVTEGCRKKELVGLEGVIVQVRPKTSLIKFDGQETATMVHTMDLQSLDPSVDAKTASLVNRNFLPEDRQL